MKSKQTSLLVAVLLLVTLFSGLVVQITQAAPQFANDKFKNLWQYSDKPVDEIPGLGRGYTWGPNSFGTLQEDYQEASGGKRQVQYFDKSRMELSPDGSFVTNGLLTKELVTGNRQDGDAKFNQQTPSTVQVAGDDNSSGGNALSPTYASFKQVITTNPGENTASNRVGQPANLGINKAGVVSTLDNPPAQVQIGYYESVLGHNVPKVFQDYQNLTGQIWDGSQVVVGKIYTDNPTANVFGYPISEAYWMKAVVAGQEKDVLVQLYERRVLTYTPSNPTEFQVEMGNIGQHYYKWRYTAPTPPTYEVNGQWYGVTAQGQKLQFSITNNIVSSVTVNFGIQPCSTSWKKSFTDMLVKGDGFAIAMDNVSFSGTFSSPSFITGKFIINNVSGACASSADTTWTATRVGLSLPAGKFDGYWDGGGSGITISLAVYSDIITNYYLKVTCGNNSTSVSTSSALVPIVDNAFSIEYKTSRSTFKVTGAFTANGQISANLQFSGDSTCGPASGNWIAKRTPFSLYDGNWIGTTYQNKVIYFGIKNNVVGDITFGQSFCNPNLDSYGVTYILKGSTSINNNSFVRDNGKLAISGQFKDQNAVNGSIKQSSTSTCPLQGTWQARKVSPFEP